MPRYPSLLQINTRVWLDRLSRRAGRRLSLAEIGDPEIERWAAQGFDWIWLLSVWRTGAAGPALDRRNAQLRAECAALLPDLGEDDICGSGFAIAGYEVGETLGGEAALAGFRARLARYGMRLMLDFVPNHTALDHPWVALHPDYYVQGSDAALAAAPQNYVRLGDDGNGRVFAHGRDPNYSGWPDTLQLDYANLALQAAQIDELLKVAGQCDGVRCDMAMLLLPEVFARSWGRVPEPFWPKAIAAVRRRHPQFTFLAEVYWDLEWTLQQQGFDYCYDKRLYDRLRSGGAAPVRAHLRADLGYQDKLARFLENHDEPRVASVFEWPRHRAAAVVAFLSPGLRFFHEGEIEGARLRVPVQLCRGPDEAADPESASFYAALLKVVNEEPVLRDGQWSQIEPREAWPGNGSANDFIAFAWTGAAGRRFVGVVNFAANRGQCRLAFPFPDLRGRMLRLTDVLGSEIYERDGSEMIDPGLYIDHAPWQVNLFRLDPV